MVQLTTGEITDTVIRGGVAIEKHDAETDTAVPQGDASLAGARYIIVNANEHPVLVDGVSHAKDQTVAELVTDAAGKAQTAADALPYGSYYLQETQAPEGYLLNDTKIPFSVTADGVLVQLTAGEVEDTVKKQAFSIIKISSNGSTGLTQLVKGAGFTVKLKSEVEAAGWDNAATYDVLATDDAGYACSKELPYGTYTVRETVTPDNMGTCPDFEVVIDTDSRTPQVWRALNDAPFEAYVRIVKKDAVTGQEVRIAGTTFKIKNTGTGEFVKQKVGRHWIDTFVTEEDGIAATPLKLGSGNYEVTEIAVPEGYLLCTKSVPFTITDTGAVRVDSDAEGDAVIVVTAVNEQVTGTVTIKKHGEVLSDVKGKGLFQKIAGAVLGMFGVKPDGNTDFAYEDAPLAGAAFELIAAEDIYTADMQTDAKGNRTIATYNGITLTAGAVVKTVTTGADGTAKVTGLPLGSYLVKEVAVPDGYTLNPDTDSFTLSYKDDHTPVVTYESVFGNERVKTELTLTKTGEKTKNPVGGATYGLYTRADIISASGTVLLPADSLIEKQTTNADGAISFEADLPLGEYYVKEIQAAEGYLLDTTEYPVSLLYQDADTAVVSAHLDVTDEETELHVSKQDITTKEELPGAKLQIFDSEGKLYEEWTSTDEPHVLYAVPAGDYILHEQYISGSVG